MKLLSNLFGGGGIPGMSASSSASAVSENRNDWGTSITVQPPFDWKPLAVIVATGFAVAFIARR